MHAHYVRKLNHDGVTLVLGGACSGKSAFAEQLINDSGLRPVYLATARAEDEEMRKRIHIHRERRKRCAGLKWETVEEPLALVETLRNCACSGHVVLVECLTLWLANLMAAGMDAEGEATRLAQSLDDLSAPTVFVSNEAGLGIVPENAMAREFRNLTGITHQIIASRAGDVYFVMAGLPLTIKYGGRHPVNDGIDNS